MTLTEVAQDFVVAEEDALRAKIYDLLAALLAKVPNRELIDQVAELEGDDGELGRAVRALTRIARATTETAAEREFNRLFIGAARGELLPYASFYMTGFLHEKPLAVLRNDMARRAIERAPNVFEPEDNIASLCEMMAGLIRGRFGADRLLDQRFGLGEPRGDEWAQFDERLEVADCAA